MCDTLRIVCLWMLTFCPWLGGQTVCIALAAGSLIAGAVWSVALTPDARRVLTASEDFTARVWDVVSGNCAHVLDGHTGWVVHVCTTQDGLRCATASHDGTARWVKATCTSPFSLCFALQFACVLLTSRCSGVQLCIHYSTALGFTIF